MKMTAHFSKFTPFSIRLVPGLLISFTALAGYAATLFLFQCGAEATETSGANLRVYGKVTASLSPNRVVFQCEDARRADILMGKLLADLFWDAGDKVKATEIRVSNQTLTVREWQPYGAVLVVKAGSSVLALGGDSTDAVTAAAANEPLLRTGTAVSSPQAPYPQTLDFYDLKAVKFYVHTMSSRRNCGLGSHWPFVQSLGLGGMAFQDLGFNTASPAPGVVEWAGADYEVREAEKQHGMIVPSLATGGALPFWMHNQFPSAMAQVNPSALMSGWGGMPSLPNQPCQSWGMPLDLNHDTCLNFLKQALQRYGGSPAVGGWQIYSGVPFAEFGYHVRSTENFDYSPLGQESFRNYLQRVKGYSLADVGQRWFADPKHFASWDEVSIPDVHGFYGNLDDGCFRISTGWTWLPKDKAGDTKGAVPDASANWLPVEMPPSQQQVTLPWPPAYNKAVFDPGQWVTRHSGKTIYLVCDVGAVRSSTHVWLNGRDLGDQKPSDGFSQPFAIDVTNLLKSGANDLCLLVPDDGKIIGPIFLTTTRPMPYPYFGTQRNAQYVDARQWQMYGIYAMHDSMFREARHLDPDRAMGMASNDIEMGDRIADLAHEYGISVQNTGREAWYFPWMCGLGLANDFYATGESSATPNEPAFANMVSWSLYDGDGSTIFFWDIEDFILMERKNGLLSKYKADLRLMGKARREQPAIAVFRSAVASGLGDQTPWNWDIGRGDLQAAHYENVYVTEREILNGRVNAYPVLFDAGSIITDPEVIAAIQRYVEAGGTFIATHKTGQHTTTEADSWPISKLTGFNVVNTNSGYPNFRFGKDLPIFTDWTDRTLPCNSGLMLKPETAGAISLGKWEDGSTAIGWRNLGKGHVLIIGADCWLRNHEFTERLFTDLHVQRTSNSSNPSIWTHKFITKNGLQNWLIACNSGKGSQTASVSMKVDRKPDQIRDMISGSAVPFTFANGEVTIPDVTIAENENRVFGVKRETLIGGIPVWWDEKLRFWKRIPSGKGVISIASAATIKPADPVGMQTIVVDQWKFMTAEDPSAPKSTDTRWQKPGFDDTKWSDMKPGPWNFQSDSLKDYKGTAYYRFHFQIPASWAGHRVALGLYGWDHSVVYDRGEFALNGKLITNEPLQQGTFNYDITDQLKPGENVLSVQVSSGTEFRGLDGAVWLAAEPVLEQSQNLLTGWNVVGADRKTTTPASFPGKAHGKYLVRDITVPPSGKNKNVFLHLETPNQWMGLVMVNGHPFYNLCYGQSFGTRVDINLAPWLKPGASNRIELWPKETAPGSQGKEQWQETDMTINAVRMGICL